MDRYNGLAILRQNDNVTVVNADFDYMIDSQDIHLMNRVEGSIAAPIEILGGMVLSEGNAELTPVEISKDGEYLSPEFHAIMVRLSEVTLHEEDKLQIWTIIDNAYEQQGVEIPEGLDLNV
jgi:hypothetical protein